MGTKKQEESELDNLKNEESLPKSQQSLRILFDNNMDRLAGELALNYFNSSIPAKEESWKDLEIIDHEKIQSKRGISALQSTKISDRLSNNRKELLTKNILVIGAGASYDMYKDIPLGQQAINLIYNSYRVGTIDYGGEELFNLSLGYLADIFVYDLNDANQLNKRIEKYNGLNIVINKEVDTVIREAKPDSNHPEYYFYQCLGLKFARSYKKVKYRAGLTDLAIEEIDFELALYLLSQMFTGDLVRGDLEKLYNKKFGYSFFYSLVAVLFRQRAIDVIINFNFDELLDQAIEDELGEGRFKRIVSEGDCLTFSQYCEEDWINGVCYRKLISPLYIKPHGTFSDKSSLRFTKDHYDDIPSGIEDLLVDLFNDYSSYDDIDRNAGNSPKDKRGDVLKNIILVGFNMGSLDLDRILRRANPKKFNIFSFISLERSNFRNNLNTALEKYCNILRKNYQGKKEENFGIYLIPLILPDSKTGTNAGCSFPENDALSSIFYILYERYQDMFHNSFRPINLPKHRLNYLIFNDSDFIESLNHKQNEKLRSTNKFHTGINLVELGVNARNRYPESYFKSSDYFKDKTLIEVLVKLQRSNGGILPAKALEYLVGKYYKLYKENFSGEEIITFMKIIKVALNQDDNFHPFKGVYLKDFDGFLNLLPESPFFKLFSTDFQNFIQIKIKDTDWKNDIKSEFIKIQSELSTMIKSYHSGAKYHFFEDFGRGDILFSHLAIDYHYSQKLKCTEIETICIISERGKRISKFAKMLSIKKPRTIFLILNSERKEDLEDKLKRPDFYEKIKNEFLESCNISDQHITYNITWNIMLLPVGYHNHHITLFLGKDPITSPDEFDICKEDLGIYYHQEGYNSIVSPIRVKEKNNIMALVHKFKSEWNKAVSVQEKGIFEGI